MNLKIFAIVAVCLCWNAPANATQYSKLSLITAAKERGVWENLKSCIDGLGLRDEWDACQYISDDYPRFAEMKDGIILSGTLTAEDVEYVLSRAQDPAVPDAALCRWYANLMSNATERVKWHGAMVTNRTDFAKLEKVEVYADGYVFVRKFKSAQAMEVEPRLSAAERRAKQEAAAKARAAAEAQRKADRIAELQTNLTALATALAKQKQYPYVLAEMLLQNELNKLIGTNTVDAVITPGK